MAARSFVHLHCHSHYSLLDGANRIPELVKHVKANGMNAIALTDHGNLYGAIEFYRECEAAGLNPILGCEVYVAPGKRTDRTPTKSSESSFHLTLLAKNLQGFKNLIKMSSLAYLEGFYRKPRVDKELMEAHSEGIICLSGCLAGEFNELILRNDLGKAVALAEWYAKTFKDNFYIEIQNNGLDLQDQCTPQAVEIARKVGVPLVATADAHYLCQEDAQAHDVLFCINTRKVRDPHRKQYPEGRIPNPYFVRTPADMYAFFPEHADAVARSQEIADGVHIELDFKKRHFPVFTPPHRKTPEQYLRELCDEGIRLRYGPEPKPEARARLEHELGIICRMGFAGYFLIVWDFVRFARENGIPASARGSGCGAVVSYVLQLSHVDPLTYDLLFERFLDPNRSEAPDIDIDFCQDRREQVIAYVKQKYGEQSVAQIATFGTLAAKAAIKDVGRVLDIPLERVNFMTKWVSPKPHTTIDDTLKESPDFRKAYETEPGTREWIDIARKLEGTNRNAGTHAAGVVIANGPLTDYVPVHRVVRKGDDDSGKQGDYVITTQWVMGDLEKVGLLKMDFLGLRTLTLVDHTLRLIKQTRGLTLDVYKDIPIDDVETYKLLQRGEAKGVFQFESDGIRELLKRMKPDNIRDIIACTALYRPGPLEGGMVDEYIECKHGRRKPQYPHPIMEEVLTETYAVMVYQEQVMRILNRLGGLELSSAYACIKAISKKKYDIIDARRVDFIKGAQQRGLPEVNAKEIFDLIVKFGGYGFNKSHSAAYAYVSYQTAYLKRHYTPEFMAALLTSEIEDGNKRDIMVEHFDDARKLGYPVQPPNINESEDDFTVVNKRILFGLVAIKGVGRSCAQEIVRVRREGGAFKNIFDFCERVDVKSVPRAAMERLIKAGAFDCLGIRRAQMDVLPRALQAAAEVQKDRKHGQLNLFETMEPNGTVATTPQLLPDVPEWPPVEKLKYEKEVLDFYISSHPLAQVEQDITLFVTHPVVQLRSAEANQEVFVGGMLTQLRYMNTSKARNGNSRYVRCKLEDLSGAVECVMWPDDYVRYKDAIQEDAIRFVEAKVERNREEPGLVIQRVLTLEQGKRERTTGINLGLRLEEHQPWHLAKVAEILKEARGSCPVFIYVRDQVGRVAQLKIGDEFRVNPAQVAKDRLEAILGPNSVSFSRHGNGAARNGK